MKLLSKKTIAAMLDMSPKSIDRMVEAGDFPPPEMTLGPRSERWYEQTVAAYVCRKQAEFAQSSDAVKVKK